MNFPLKIKGIEIVERGKEKSIPQHESQHGPSWLFPSTAFDTEFLFF